MRETKRGFTLIELLVVIAIIAILAAILFPVFVTAKEKGKQTTCVYNMKQIGMGVIAYANDWSNWTPHPAAVPADDNLSSVGWEHEWIYYNVGLDKLFTTGVLKCSAAIFFCPSIAPSARGGKRWNGWDCVGAMNSRNYPGWIRFGYLVRNKTASGAWPTWASRRHAFSIAGSEGRRAYLMENMWGVLPGTDPPHRTGWNVFYLDGHVTHAPKTAARAFGWYNGLDYGVAFSNFDKHAGLGQR